MGPLDFANHALNFAAPALCVGLFLALLAPWVLRPAAVRLSWQGQSAVNALAGFAALALGLWFFGNDGKMASYGAMLCACSLAQWAGMRFGH